MEAPEKMGKQAAHGMTIDDEPASPVGGMFRGDALGLEEYFRWHGASGQGIRLQRRFLALKSLGHDASVKKIVAVLDSHI